MNKSKTQSIEAINSTVNSEDYICLTDMIKDEDETFFINDWLRNANTLEYLSVWESLNNPDFGYDEFATIRNKTGINSFKLDIKDWIEKTNAIGIISKINKTYAHKDIAFNFGMWISPVFQLFIAKEYQKLKDTESYQNGLEWDIKRMLSKASYQKQASAVKKHILPKARYSKAKEWLLYADEADLVNIALFGCTAKEWRKLNPQKTTKNKNIRDAASINELAILTNVETLNSILIKNGLSKKDRLRILAETAKEQKEMLEKIDFLKLTKNTADSTFINDKR